MTLNITGNVSATGLTSTARAETPPKTPESSLNTNADFTTFLKMLTTQIQYQDPLSPVESSDFAVQLATFSSVEQQTKTNQLLERLVGDGLGETAGWIGKIARTKTPAWFAQQPIEMELEPHPKADKAILKVYNKNNVLVSSQDVTGQSGLVSWSGPDKARAKLPDGLYTFRLESYDTSLGADKSLLESSKVPVYSYIQETRIGKDGIELVFPGEASAKVSEIEALLGGGTYIPPQPVPGPKAAP